MIKYYITNIILFIISSLKISAQDFSYQTGDLLFQDLDCGALCDAIEQVTPGVQGRHFSHVGIAYVVQDSVWIVEAIDKDVHLTPLSRFLQRQQDSSGRPKVIVGRLKKAYRNLNSRAIAFALAQRGKPYDDAFLPDNGKYYCSELVYDAYKEANGQRAFFNRYPMTFKEPRSGKTHPAWKSYFKEMDMKIPEGKPGCNPGSIAISDAVEIVQEYY